MGQGTKNQSRHQQITNNRRGIDTLTGAMTEMLKAWELHVERGEDGDPLLTHVEIDTKLDTVAKLTADLIGSLDSLRGLVLFNAQPFWKRWWQTWREHRAILKDTMRPQFIPPTEPPEKIITSPVKLTDPQIEALKEDHKKILGGARTSAEDRVSPRVDSADGISSTEKEERADAVPRDPDDADRVFGNLAAKAREAQGQGS